MKLNKNGGIEIPVVSSDTLIDEDTELVINTVLEDASNLEVIDMKPIKVVEQKRVNPALIIDAKFDLELKFLLTLVVKETQGIDNLIELCVLIDNTLRPVGFIKFDFETILSILSYRNFELRLADFNKVLDSDTLLLLP